MKLIQVMTLLGGANCLVYAMSPLSASLARLNRRNDSSGDPGPVNQTPMVQLNPDSNFHFQILASMGLAFYEGADIGEVLTTAYKIKPNDWEGWYQAFNALAERVGQKAADIDSEKYPISARNTLFKEATYYRASDTYVRENTSDPRIMDAWGKQLSAFDKAIALLPVPGERITLNGTLPSNASFEIPAIFYRSGKPGKSPTIIMCNGYDASQEDLYHVMGAAALQRGFNVISFEGPGQPSPRRYQNLGFIPEWEVVVTPVVDYALTLEEVDPSAIGLMGLSFGGLLAPRAAAFEHRLAGVMALDGVYDFFASLLGLFEAFPDIGKLYAAGDKVTFDKTIFDMVMELKKSNPDGNPLRWGLWQGLFAFNVDSPYEYFKRTEAYTLKDVVKNIKTPVFVGEAENEGFFPGQAKDLADALGDLAVHHVFESIDGAGEHCALGGLTLQNQVVLDWFQDLVTNCSSD